MIINVCSRSKYYKGYDINLCIFNSNAILLIKGANIIKEISIWKNSNQC